MEYISIESFKCFRDIKVPISDLSVFAGANGNGKSTAIQALLFLRRTVEHCAKWNGDSYVYKETNNLNVELNGSYCLALGNSNYVLPINSENNLITLGVTQDDLKFKVEYDAPDNQLWLTPKSVENDFGDMPLSILFQEFYYLNAERLGPRISQGIKFFDYPSAGQQGEFVAQLIADTDQNYRFEVDEARRHPNRKSPRLEQQVNAWLDELMPGVSIVASLDTNTHAAQIKIENHFTRGNSTLATNIGFGISYVLPIIVTGLIAKKGRYMIVENPEAHLHPSAQSKIGRFLAMVALAGVKVIVETHSDHVINGIQIATAKGEIDASNVVINYFHQKSEAKQPDVVSIHISDKGELSEWPTGFFDQSQKDYAELFKLRKG